jgi:hypothetical protein
MTRVLLSRRFEVYDSIRYSSRITKQTNLKRITNFILSIGRVNGYENIGAIEEIVLVTDFTDSYSDNTPHCYILNT